MSDLLDHVPARKVADAALSRDSDNPPSPTPITIAKSSREALRLAIDRYKGRWLLNCRLWFADRETGELRPGHQGWAISAEKLPQVIAALRKLEAEARAAGLLG